MVAGVGLMGCTQLAYAEQYQYKNAQGEIVVSQELPPSGVSYAVLDDNNVYQYLVPAPPLEVMVGVEPDTGAAARDEGVPVASLAAVRGGERRR